MQKITDHLCFEKRARETGVCSTFNELARVAHASLQMKTIDAKFEETHAGE